MTQNDAAQDSLGRDPRNEFLGHPKGLFLLFLVEMWERFSYYGMRGLLILYLIAVTSIYELKPGVYTNTLQIKESATAAQNPQDNVHSADITIAVGQQAPAASSETWTRSGQTSLVVHRLKKTPDPSNPGKFVWIRDESPGQSPLVVAVKPGEKPTGAEFGFEITNPTDQPIKCLVGIKRADDKKQADGQRTFFTVNNSPEEVATDIVPDKDLAADAKKRPFQVIVTPNNHQSGRNWLQADASVLYAWYTGLAYLFPIIGGLVADKLIGTHRSMLIGGILITLGHIILGVSGFGELSHSASGMSMFVFGLAVIVLGTGHFKPTVSVMVGQLYAQGDPRRDGAFTIFYMGINLGAFLCAFVAGTLGEKVGWHWGFAAAAAGMILGLVLYLFGRPVYLKGIGEAPKANANATSTLFLVGSLAAAALFGLVFHQGWIGSLGDGIRKLQTQPVLSAAIIGVLLAGILAWVTWFIAQNRPEDRGPVVTIFIFMLFNAFFWIAFEQAGSSLNVFTEQNTNRHIGGFEVPATWFQSVNAGLIFILAPLFAGLWTYLGRRGMNPSQPVKIAVGLIFLGIGYIFMVTAGQITIGGAAKASMFFILATYFWHTVGELCLSPTGLSYVTKAAPVKFVSLLMGIWFVSSFIANLGGGLIASLVKDVEKGTLKLPWSFGGQADFFFLFVVFSIGPGILILLLTPILKKLMRPGT